MQNNKQKPDFYVSNEILDDFHRIRELLNSNVFTNDEYRVFIKAAFIEILICLRDLTYKTECFSSRISFTDDVIFNGRVVYDITSLIEFMRNAVCHKESENNYAEKNIRILDFIRGKHTHVFFEKQLINDYCDDICFFFGNQKIYLKRHIIRAYKEAEEKLLPLLKTQ
jgi:hypothetical protein